MVIYLDILLLINLFINYFLLLSTAKFTHQKPKRLRLCITSGIGSLFSLIIFLPPFSFFLQVLIKLLMAGMLVLCAFEISSFRVYIKTLLLFFGINFVFAGAMIALWLFWPLDNMMIQNGFVYFNISALALAVSTILAYLAICIIKRVTDRAVAKRELYSLWIETDGKQVLLKSFLDSGNRLTDGFSGMPVAVCEYKAVKPLIPASLQQSFASSKIDEIPGDSTAWKTRLRLIPYDMVGKQGLMLCFKPDAIYVGEDKDIKQNALVGVTPSKLSDGEYTALIGPGFILPQT